MDEQKGSNEVKYGGPKPFAWTHDYLFELLTTGKSRIIRSAALAGAFKMIDRADFVPPNYYEYAYDDAEIPLGYDELLDKPTVIASMLQLLRPRSGGNYLDIGSGSGYVAALLGFVCGSGGHVYSLERKQFLSDIARINIKKYPFLGNVEIVFKDGSLGLESKAPFDAIHISAAYENIPQELLMQLKIGGRLVIPTTDRALHLFERTGDKEFHESIQKAYFFDKIQVGIV